MRISDWSSDVCSSDLDRSGPSWTAQIAEEAGKYVNTRRDTTRATHYTDAEGPDFQTVEISYDVGPRGSRVRKVKYTRPGSRGDIIPLAIAKYGEPTLRRLSGIRYCSSEKECRDSFMSDMPTASLEVYQSNTSRSEEHTSELQSLMRISYPVFCLKKKKK